MNTYELAGRGCTTGWDARTNDVNGENFYKMRPIEVAAQAGNVTEFRAIMLDPAFEPNGARVRYFHAAGQWDLSTLLNTASLAVLGVILWYAGLLAMKGD